VAEEKQPFDKPAYDMRYSKENTKRYYLRLNKTYDADIIKHLDRQGNVNGYIKRLIRDDIGHTEK